jgi:hypothetical protein
MTINNKDVLASGVDASNADAASATGNTDISARDIKLDANINNAFVPVGSNIVINGNLCFSELTSTEVLRN